MQCTQGLFIIGLHFLVMIVSMNCLNILPFSLLFFLFSLGNPQSYKTLGFRFRLTNLKEIASEDYLNHIVSKSFPFFFFNVVCQGSLMGPWLETHFQCCTGPVLLSMVSLMSPLFFLINKYVVVILFLCSEYVLSQYGLEKCLQLL